MIYYKTQEEIELIRESCLLVSKSLALAASLIEPGISCLELDKKAEEFIRDNDAVPGFLGYNGFPGTLCMSLNEGVVHGIPTSYEFKEDDIISIDCGVFKNGFYGDSAFTFALSETKKETLELMSVTRTSLYKGIDAAVVGNRVGDIGWAVQEYAERNNGYGVVRELVGHGIGRNLHEEPQVPNYGKRGRGMLLKDGLVIAIEPMVNMGTKNVMQSEDGWTIITKDRKPSAHYEHTVVVKKGKADILSDHSFVEEAIKNNANLVEISIKS